jgi:HAD superfamily hydrolase (TIGR01509 family)
MHAMATPAAGSERGVLQAVLFDMDGLLVDTEPLWFEVEQDVMARLGGSWTAADQGALVGGSLQRSVGYLLSRASRPASFEQVARWLIDGMADLLVRRPAELMPGAAELVTAVRKAGLACALVTSSERVIMDVVLTSLAAEDLAFDVTVCGADVRNSKPDPEPYLRACALLGADPARCVALEDSPNGVTAAAAAGCITIAVPGVAPIAPAPGLIIVASLAELDVEALSALTACRG